MKKSLLVTLSSAAILSGIVFFNNVAEENSSEMQKIKKSKSEKLYSERKKKMKGLMAFDKPDMFEKFHAEIRTEKGKSAPGYKQNYTFEELEKAQQSSSLRKGTNNIVWTERGPGNVSGRTRGIIVDVADNTHNTWFAGSAGGGIWKTTDAGETWTEKTFNNLNLATTSLVQSISNPDVMYAGTGEGFGGGGAIKGNGLFKSNDHGETWTQITTTAGDTNFSYVNRVIVNPSDENIVLVATNLAIMKTIDGGENWTKVYTPAGRVQQILANPNSFDTLYASENSVGILKSVDAGETWSKSSTGIGSVARMEIAISPSNSNILYISAQAGSDSHLYKSEDAAGTWKRFTYSNDEDPKWLGSQGWYDNTLAVHPFNENIVFLGGIDSWKAELDTATSSNVGVKGIIENGTEVFMAPVNYGLSFWKGGCGFGKDVFGSTNLTESDYTAIEIRFGNKTQKAHLFDFVAGYPYVDMVDVPFEVWDVTNNKQLAVSIYDKEHNNTFDLNTDYQKSDYIFVHAVDYSETADDSIKVSSKYKNTFFLGPILASGATWNPNSLPESTFKIDYGSSNLGTANFKKLSYWYLDVKNPQYAHADHHNFTIVKTGESTFRFIDGNDGGVAYTDNEGATWKQPTNGYNSTQFYGADKHPTKDEYIGGTQDNGSFKSELGENATNATAYAEVLGGDGFIGVWNNEDPNMVLTALYNNRLYRTTTNSNNPSEWVTAQKGMVDANDDANSAFITTVDKTKLDGYFIVCPGGSGVWRSVNFGETWTLATMDSGWEFSTYHTSIAISAADQRTVWAGGWNGYIQVSTDGALNFKTVAKYTAISSNKLSGIATHPTEPNTAFMIFSQSGNPKIVKTTDLGQTWTDITGFEGNTESSNGFPNVAVYDLLVMPYDTNIYWACTEIGIFVSEDAGANWTYMNDASFPAVSIWEANIVGDQVVLATHGRGIWTATIPELANYTKPVLPKFPRLTKAGLSGFKIELKSEFDSTIVIVDGAKYYKLDATGVKDTSLNYPTSEDVTVSVQIKSYKAGEVYESAAKELTMVKTNSKVWGYANDFNEETNDFYGDLTTTKIRGFDDKALHTDHPYKGDSTYYHTLRAPVVVSSENATLSYRDVALIEPGNDDGFWDYVTVEATKDGINWIELIDRYDANSAPVWKNNYDEAGETPGDKSMFISHEINLLDKFQAGDEIFIRFKLFADQNTTGWGWAIDDLKIQEALVGTEKLNEIPNSFELYQNYPNPFNPTTNIKIDVPSAAKVNLTIFNAIGERVETLVDKEMAAGQYIINWDASRFSSGVYFYRLSSNDFVKSKKLMLLK